MKQKEPHCPLGSECMEMDAATNSFSRCAWSVKLAGEDPQTKQPLDTWRCSMAWLPILSIEISQTNRGQTAALESLRNEIVKSMAGLSESFNSLALSLQAVANKSEPPNYDQIRISRNDALLEKKE